MLFKLLKYTYKISKQVAKGKVIVSTKYVSITTVQFTSKFTETLVFSSTCLDTFHR